METCQYCHGLKSSDFHKCGNYCTRCNSSRLSMTDICYKCRKNDCLVRCPNPVYSEYNVFNDNLINYGHDDTINYSPHPPRIINYNSLSDVEEDIPDLYDIEWTPPLRDPRVMRGPLAPSLDYRGRRSMSPSPPPVNGGTAMLDMDDYYTYFDVPPPPPPPPSSPPLPLPSETLIDEPVEFDESKACNICMAKNVDCLIIHQNEPSAHMTCCFECATRINREKNECPNCRDQIKQIIKIYK